MHQGTGRHPGRTAAPMICLASPLLPKVTALQGWARHLCSSHLLADLTQPTSSQTASSPPWMPCASPLRHLQAPLVWSSYLSGTSRHLTLRVSLVSVSRAPLAAWALWCPSQVLAPLLLDRRHLGCPLTRGSQDPGTRIIRRLANIPKSWLNARHSAEGFIPSPPR